MRAAYDALDGAMKERLAGLTGLHGHTSGPAGGELYRNNEAAKTADREYDEKRWPAIARHPVTGREILFVNPMHVHGFAGAWKKDAAWEPSSRNWRGTRPRSGSFTTTTGGSATW